MTKDANTSAPQVLSIVPQLPHTAQNKECVTRLEEWLTLAKEKGFVSVGFIGVGADRSSVTGMSDPPCGYSDNMIAAASKLIYRLNKEVDERSVHISVDDSDDDDTPA